MECPRGPLLRWQRRRWLRRAAAHARKSPLALRPRRRRRPSAAARPYLPSGPVGAAVIVAEFPGAQPTGVRAASPPRLQPNPLRWRRRPETLARPRKRARDWAPPYRHPLMLTRLDRPRRPSLPRTWWIVSSNHRDHHSRQHGPRGLPLRATRPVVRPREATPSTPLPGQGRTGTTRPPQRRQWRIRGNLVTLRRAAGTQTRHLRAGGLVGCRTVVRLIRRRRVRRPPRGPQAPPLERGPSTKPGADPPQGRSHAAGRAIPSASAVPRGVALFLAPYVSPTRVPLPVKESQRGVFNATR
jgi:hypothetical protein